MFSAVGDGFVKGHRLILSAVKGFTRFVWLHDGIGQVADPDSEVFDVEVFAVLAFKTNAYFLADRQKSAEQFAVLIGHIFAYDLFDYFGCCHSVLSACGG